MLLENKVAIVTGAARGLGFAIARRFLEEGARVVVADIDINGPAAAKELGVYGPVNYLECNVGERLDVRRLVTETVDAFGGIDVLVNNAAILGPAEFLDVEDDDFDKVIRVNMKGAFMCAQEVARHMVERIKAGGGPGAIINMSSVNAVFTIPNQVVYSMSKGGVSQLTKAMAVGLAPYGIRANAIGPGSILTDMFKIVLSEQPEARNRVLSRTPLGRFGEPREIAAIAAFLASNESSYITGQTIYADGGRLALNYTVPVSG